jgi:Mrp family chromosome partitioning ATPase
MARMLEALRRTADAMGDMDGGESTAQAAPSEPLADATDAGQAATGNAGEPIDDEMPYIEVGGPRQAGTLPAVAAAAPFRAATLKMPVPAGVSLRTPVVRSASPRIAAELVTHHQPQHPVSIEYADLFAQLVPDPEEGTQVLVFTCLAAGSGTTTALLNLAIAGAMAHERHVVVVDANFPRPAVAPRLGMGPCKGLGDVLRGTMALDQAVQPSAIANLSVLPAGETDLVLDHVDALRWILGWLRDRFDVVLVDGPAWGESSDDWYRTLARASDAFYLVVDGAESTHPRVRTMMRDLGRLGGHLGGLVVTR